ncbi:hypothetical protein IW262DRAFT_1368642 [Armillaria fumosa]|nr:hypothetical protein IW262DRAFT_1368642 [Armillaria fumosa]
MLVIGFLMPYWFAHPHLPAFFQLYFCSSLAAASQQSAPTAHKGIQHLAEISHIRLTSCINLFYIRESLCDLPGFLDGILPESVDWQLLFELRAVLTFDKERHATFRA